MKLPLFSFFALFLICMCCGCEKTSTYYHYEKPFGQLNGNVKTVTDTIYISGDDDVWCPMQTIVYHFDTLNRLSEEHMCLFNSTIDEWGVETDTTLSYSQTTKHRYDRNGRRVETRIRSCSYRNDTMRSTETFMKLSAFNRNREKWKMTLTDSLEHRSVAYSVKKMYSEYNVFTIQTNLETKETYKTVSHFDGHGNMVQKNIIDETEELTITLYEYGDDHLLLGTAQNHFEYGEFDDEGNWLKRFEKDPEERVLTALHRKIEYRR